MLLTLLVRVLVPFLMFVVLYVLGTGLVKVLNTFPNLKPSEKVSGYMFTAFMIIAVFMAIFWPIVFPGLYEWMQNVPLWFKDLNVAG